MFGLNKVDGNDPRVCRQEIGGAWSGKSSAQTGMANGLITGTRIATSMGWRDVDALAQGDMVLTFDHGMQPIKSITRGFLWNTDTECPRALWPLYIPAETCGNNAPLMVLPEQAVMLESDLADMLYGDPFSLVNASDLIGFSGVEYVRPADAVEVIEIQFENAEIVFSETGIQFLCRAEQAESVLDMITGAAVAAYTILNTTETKLVVDSLAKAQTEPCHMTA